MIVPEHLKELYESMKTGPIGDMNRQLAQAIVDGQRREREEERRKEEDLREQERREQKHKEQELKEAVARKAMEEATARKVAEEAAVAAKKAEEEAAIKKAVKDAEEAKLALKRANLEKAVDARFTIDFLQKFLEKLEEFNAACENINNDAEKSLSGIDFDYKNNIERLLAEYKNGVNELISKKDKALKDYAQKLQNLNKNEESRYKTLYAQIIESKNGEGSDTPENLRNQLFANAEKIRIDREKFWNEYQSACAEILQKFDNRQENAKEVYRKQAELECQCQKSNERMQSDVLKKINAEKEKFTAELFPPEEMHKEYVDIYATDPLFGDYKSIKSYNRPKGVCIARLSSNLLTLNYYAEALLETHYPVFYRKKKLIMPYCINVGLTNGVCFLQNNANRDTIYKTIQSFILKLLLQTQPGLLKLTLYDSEGSGKNLIGLSHIDKRIKGENILTDTNELKRALEAAVSDMNTTIQKVLGSKHADKTLMDYNENAGEQAKPYHIICITDFPNGLGKDHLELITKIVRSGRQAGVFVVVALDTEYSPKNSYDRIDTSVLQSEMSVIESSDNRLNLSLSDSFPDTDLLEEIQGYINSEIKKTGKGKVNIDNRVGENKLWQSDSREGIKAPIGQLSITELKDFELSVEDGSSNTPHHCLIGGSTGSGKTVLLHNIICYTAWNYSPDEVQFILLDYKEGTEFKVYENLPHTKVLSINSEREYGISVLEYISLEIERRGKEFKKFNAQNIAKYRENSKQNLPRLLIIIDEFQVLLSGDMKTSTFVSKALDDIGRRGRSFGINLILSSQSLSGVDITQTLSHLGLRIALKLNTPKDCDHFLEQGNHEPFNVLEKKGEAIYNANGGQKKDNVRFQVNYLSDKDLAIKISALQKKSIEVYGSDKPFAPRFSYDGEISASFVEREYTPDHRKCKIYVGEPVALEAEHASYSLLTDNESNVLVVGQDILAAMSILGHSIRQIVPQSFDECKIYICNKVNKNNDYYGKLDSLVDEFGKKVNLLENDLEIQRVIEVIFEEVEKRKVESCKNRIVLVFADIYNMRMLRKSGYADSPLAQKLINILKDGPGLGVHCIVHASSFDNLKNILEVHSMLNEFNIRIELRGGDGYKIFQSNEVGIEKSSPDRENVANMRTLQTNGIRKIKVYSFNT